MEKKEVRYQKEKCRARMSFKELKDKFMIVKKFRG